MEVQHEGSSQSLASRPSSSLHVFSDSTLPPGAQCLSVEWKLQLVAFSNGHVVNLAPLQENHVPESHISRTEQLVETPAGTQVSRLAWSDPSGDGRSERLTAELAVGGSSGLVAVVRVEVESLDSRRDGENWFRVLEVKWLCRASRISGDVQHGDMRALTWRPNWTTETSVLGALYAEKVEVIVNGTLNSIAAASDGPEGASSAPTQLCALTWTPGVSVDCLQGVVLVSTSELWLMHCQPDAARSVFVRRVVLVGSGWTGMRAMALHAGGEVPALVCTRDRTLSLDRRLLERGPLGGPDDEELEGEKEQEQGGVLDLTGKHPAPPPHHHPASSLLVLGDNKGFPQVPSSLLLESDVALLARSGCQAKLCVLPLTSLLHHPATAPPSTSSSTTTSPRAVEILPEDPRMCQPLPDLHLPDMLCVEPGLVMVGSTSSFTGAAPIHLFTLDKSHGLSPQRRLHLRPPAEVFASGVMGDGEALQLGGTSSRRMCLLGLSLRTPGMVCTHTTPTPPPHHSTHRTSPPANSGGVCVLLGRLRTQAKEPSIFSAPTKKSANQIDTVHLATYPLNDVSPSHSTSSSGNSGDIFSNPRSSIRTSKENNRLPDSVAARLKALGVTLPSKDDVMKDETHDPCNSDDETPSKFQACSTDSTQQTKNVMAHFPDPKNAGMPDVRNLAKAVNPNVEFNSHMKSPSTSDQSIQEAIRKLQEHLDSRFDRIDTVLASLDWRVKGLEATVSRMTSQ